MHHGNLGFHKEKSTVLQNSVSKFVFQKSGIFESIKYVYNIENKLLFSLYLGTYMQNL